MIDARLAKALAAISAALAVQRDAAEKAEQSISRLTCAGHDAMHLYHLRRALGVK